MDLNAMATGDLVSLAREQVVVSKLDEAVLHELQARYSRQDCPVEQRSAIVELDRTVFIPHFGQTKLPPGIIPLGRAKSTSLPGSPHSQKQSSPVNRRNARPVRGTNGLTTFADAVRQALRELLESKHLFQSVRLDIDKLLEAIPKRKRVPKDLPQVARLVVSSLNEMPRRQAKLANLCATVKFGWPWRFTSTKTSGENLDGIISLPTIRIPCAHCDAAKQPHHARVAGNEISYCLYEAKVNGEEQIQIFALPYQCQNCLTEPVMFFVRRDDMKLTLLGRSQFEPIAVPDCIPKVVAMHHRAAEIAFKTGHCLAAIFYLRTLIEQYMKSIVKPIGRISGEELADQYQKQLPIDFPSRFPSFKRIYQDLSAAMHDAREDDELFRSSLENVGKHFETVRLLGK